MERLSTRGRGLMDEYRGRISPSGPRIDRNWAAIETRARAAAPPVRRGWLRIAIAAGVLAAGVAALLSMRPERSQEITPRHEIAPYELEPQPAAAPVVEAPQCEAPEPAARAEPIEVPAPVPEPPAVRTAARKPAPAAPKRSDDDLAHALAQEAALLRRARAQLRDGDATAALRVLDEHTRRFADGALVEEALVLRIDARCAAGQRERARTDADAFLRRYATSPLAARVRRACAEPP
ncbi:MAG TPA: hypothetical protein VG755_33030 [Nannocystaceae bacterium]|nr:hypothetical protein [Nannocystaceae bacterium]